MVEAHGMPPMHSMMTPEMQMAAASQSIMGSAVPGAAQGNYFIFYCRVSQNIVSRSYGYCGGAVDSIISVFHSCIAQASTWSLRPHLSQSDKQLLIYGSAEANLVVASKTALLLFSSSVRIK